MNVYELKLSFMLVSSDVKLLKFSGKSLSVTLDLWLKGQTC